MKSLLVFISLLSIHASAEVPPLELKIYSNDSFAAPGGLGHDIIPLFEKKYRCRVRLLPSGGGGQLLGRLQLDHQRGQSSAHLVVGLDQHLWARARNWIEPWKKWRPQGYARLIQEVLKSDPNVGLLPYDYGIFAWMIDKRQLEKINTKPPGNLSNLLNKTWKRNLILEDPRTSSAGLSFLLYTQKILGSSTREFWKQMKTQWLTLTPGWDGAYSLFLKGEAPLVWSYTTSQAYHAEHGDREGRYQAILFEEGQPIQIEGAGFIRRSWESSQIRYLAEQFLEFLISPEVQERVPRKNWMLPVLRGVQLPEGFKKLPQAKRLVITNDSPEEVARALEDWSRAVSGS